MNQKKDFHKYNSFSNTENLNLQRLITQVLIFFILRAWKIQGQIK